MKGVRPWQDGHAIVNVTFAVDFSAPPPAPALREVSALHSKFREKYPRKREATGNTIELSLDAIAGGGSPAVRPSGLVVFDSLRPDGEVERAITLQGNQLTIARGDYTRWSETWPDVRGVFQKILPIIMESVDVQAIHLQYHDQFHLDMNRTNLATDQIFRRGSRLLAPNVFEVKDLWHSYHGYFDYVEKPFAAQLLHIVETDVITPPNGELAARIRLNHRALPGAVHAAVVEGKPLTDPKELIGDGNSLLDAYMNLMHDIDKSLLAEVVTDEICELIRLQRSK